MSARNPQSNGRATFDDSDTIIVISDGPDDTTVRPRPPNVPRWFTPGREPPPELGLPSAKEPPTSPPPKT